LKKAEAKGLRWPLPEAIDDKEIYRILFPKDTTATVKAEPDFAHVNKQLLRKGVTLTLCWAEYCDSCIKGGKEPYQYSAFCHRYRAWAEANNVVMHIERRPGEQMMVDWAGTTMATVDRDTGEICKVYIFVACLPYSSYLYAEGFHFMDSESWLLAHIHTFEFFGGTVPIVVPDNLKTGITRNTYDELVVNESYRRLAEYYGFAVVPARPKKPRDKGAVESAVGVITRSVIAPLRDRTFFSLTDLNDALLEKLDEVLSRPFQKREGSRESVFFEQEKDTLIPLPKKRFEVYVAKTATVPYNYHISVDSIFYSVPFQYVKQEVEVRISKSVVAVYTGAERIASHKRSYSYKGSYVTNPDHMPDAHKDFVEWTGERFRKWARQKGEATAGVIEAILSAKPIEQQAYRSCRAVMSLAEKHGDTRLEEACIRALEINRHPSYKTVKALITRIMDADSAPLVDDNQFAYLRGAEFFNVDTKERKSPGGDNDYDAKEGE
jgi:transposase